MWLNELVSLTKSKTFSMFYDLTCDRRDSVTCMQNFRSLRNTFSAEELCEERTNRQKNGVNGILPDERILKNEKYLPCVFSEIKNFA